MAKKILNFATAIVGYPTRFIKDSDGNLHLLPIIASPSITTGAVNVELILLDDTGLVYYTTNPFSPKDKLFTDEMVNEYFAKPYETKEINVFKEGETGIEYAYNDQTSPQDYYRCLSCGDDDILIHFSYCPNCGCKIVEEERPFE